MPKFIEVTVGTNQTHLVNVDHIVDVCKRRCESSSGEEFFTCTIETSMMQVPALHVNETYEQIKTMMGEGDTSVQMADNRSIGAFEKYLSGEKGV